MYYHPMGLCEIWSVDKTYKWKFHAPAAFAPPEENVVVYPYLTGITVTQELKSIPAFEITLDAPYEDGIKMLENDSNGSSPFNVQNLVRVAIGYPSMNMWTPWYYGMLASGGQGLQITPEGVNGTVSVQQANWQDEHVAAGNSGWASSAEEMVDKLVSLMGAESVISPAASDAFAAKTAHHPNQPWCTHGKTNMEALTHLCALCGVTMTPHNTNDSGQQAVISFTAEYEISDYGRSEELTENTYIMRGIFNPAENIYPILSWGPEDSVASWLGSKPANTNEGVTSSAINPVTGKIVSVDVGPGEADTPAFGDQSEKGPAQDRTTADGKVVDKAVDGSTALTAYLSTPASSDAPDSGCEGDLRSKAKMQMNQGNMVAIGTISTLGVPHQGIKKKINVLGCSARYNGPYITHAVTHRWSPGTYDSDLKVLRQGTFGTDESTKASMIVEQLPKG